MILQQLGEPKSKKGLDIKPMGHVCQREEFMWFQFCVGSAASHHHLLLLAAKSQPVTKASSTQWPFSTITPTPLRSEPEIFLQPSLLDHPHLTNPSPACCWLMEPGHLLL